MSPLTRYWLKVLVILVSFSIAIGYVMGLAVFSCWVAKTYDSPGLGIAILIFGVVFPAALLEARNLE